MAVCRVTLDVNTAAISGAVKFEPLPNQIVGGKAVDQKLVVAEASANEYNADLIQGAEYRLLSSRFRFGNEVFTCPETATADLIDLIDGAAGD